MDRIKPIGHLVIKRLAVVWLVRLGCGVAAAEVRCPKAKYRMVASGWLDHADGGLLDAGGCEGDRARLGIRCLRSTHTSLRCRTNVRDPTLGVESHDRAKIDSRNMNWIPRDRKIR